VRHAEGAAPGSVRPGRRLVATAAVIALALGVIGVVLALQAHRQARLNVVDDAQGRVRTNIADARRYMTDRLEVLDTIARAEAARDAPVPVLRASLAEYAARPQSGFSEGIAWFDARGRLLAASGPPARTAAAAAGPVLADARAATADPRYLGVIRTVVPAGGREPVVAVAVPVRRGGRPTGEVIVGGVGVGLLRRVVGNLERSLGDRITVVDAEGRVLAAPGLDRVVDASGAPLVRAAAVDTAGDGFGRARYREEADGVLGEPGRLVAYIRDPQPTGWTFFLEADAAEAYAGPDRTRALQLGGIAALVLLAVGAAAVVGRRMDQLAGTAERRRRLLQAEAHRLGALQGASGRFAAADSEDEVLVITAESARTGVGADVAWAWAPADDGGEGAAAGGDGAAPPAEAEVLAGAPAPRWWDAAEAADPPPATVGMGALGVLPLAGGGRLVVGRRAPAGFDEDERELLDALAAQAGQALSRARLFAREHEVAVQLQSSLLPPGLPVVPGLDVGTLYRAGTERMEVGGDWFDLLALPGGGAVATVGDVVGRGVRAAAAMGQLRSALAALALEDPSPAAVLTRLDAFAATLPDALMATVACAWIPPGGESVAYACAGHPPPVLTTPGGASALLQEGRSAPLGIAGPARRSARVAMPPGAALVLYTDGLVERRGVPIDVRLEALRAAAGGLGDRPAREICDALFAAVGPDGDGDAARRGGDDVALLCVRRAEAAPL